MLLFELIDYFTGMGKPPCFVFGKYGFPACYDLKNTTMSRDKLGFYAQSVVQFFRQTGGFRLIVSLGAVLDFDFHGIPPDYADFSHRGGR